MLSLKFLQNKSIRFKYSGPEPKFPTYADLILATIRALACISRSFCSQFENWSVW